MLYHFRITPEGKEPFEVNSTTRDILAWEEEKPGRSVSQLANPHMADLYGIAHAASRREGLFTGSFQEFKANCDLDVLGPQEEVRPTKRGR